MSDEQSTEAKRLFEQEDAGKYLPDNLPGEMRMSRRDFKLFLVALVSDEEPNEKLRALFREAQAAPGGLPCPQCANLDYLRHFVEPISDADWLSLSDADLHNVVREIFDITASLYWEDRALEIASLIRSYCGRRYKGGDTFAGKQG